ncbi:helix-turn-helix domain-containing protein [Tsukamurella tyrosinosolvens]|uniref:helix-turn-helix domain-containing protein n=1 Tax=Tsukamurella tyrosinosolvens TaxID=57704 RepID=UPI0036CD8FA4
MSPTPAPKPPLSPMLEEFGKRVRARRKALGLSQEQAAVRCHMHWTNLARVERAQQSIRIETALKLARGLDTTPGALLDGLPIDDGENG